MEAKYDRPPRNTSRAHGAHVAKMHTLKALEAAVILSGVPLTQGVLVEEAAALGLELTELAQLVAEKARAERELEVARRVYKTGI